MISHPAPCPSLSSAIDSPTRRRLPPLLRRAWFGLNQAFRRRTLHTGITPDQFTVLRTLVESDAKGLNQSELGRRIASDPNTMTSLLERMETAGLVERSADETDRRANRICVTGAGRRKFARVRQYAVELQIRILSALAEEKREEFLAQLEIVAQACQQVNEEFPPEARARVRSRTRQLRRAL